MHTTKNYWVCPWPRYSPSEHPWWHTPTALRPSNGHTRPCPTLGSLWALCGFFQTWVATDGDTSNGRLQGGILHPPLGAFSSGTKKASACLDWRWLGNPYGGRDCRLCWQTSRNRKSITIVSCDSTEIHAALTPQGTWQWREDRTPFHGSLVA
jgi:hypothetical protein